MRHIVEYCLLFLDVLLVTLIIPQIIFTSNIGMCCVEVYNVKTLQMTSPYWELATWLDLAWYGFVMKANGFTSAASKWSFIRH